MKKVCPTHGEKQVGRFCNQCGEGLVETTEQSISAILNATVTVSCTNCGHKLEYGKQVYCNKCGQKVDMSQAVN